jgi:PAS domain S-box-containing protein
MDEYSAFIDRVRSGEALDRVETVFISKDGREILVDGNVSGQFKNGQFVATRAIFRDITERKKMEDDLRHYSEHLGELERLGLPNS